MFSVAVKGYGIVIWDGDGMWRTFGANESMSATLSARVELALQDLGYGHRTDDAVCAALLEIAGAHPSATAATDPGDAARRPLN